MMKYYNLITVSAVSLLLVTGVSFAENTSQDSISARTVPSSDNSAVSGTDSTIKKDSSYIRSLLSAFFALENRRRDIFKFDSVPDFKNPYFTGAPELYRKNSTSFSDALRYHPLFSTVRFGLSSSLNRNLLYGTVAPVTSIQSKNGSVNTPYSLFPINPSNHFSTEKEGVSIDNSGIRLLDFPVNTALPEVLLLWENGVFDENILDVRITRPLTRAIMINVYSNFRYFNGMEYSHDANDIFNFYSNFYSDTSKISHTGYNPKVDEHVSGIGLQYRGKKDNTVNLKFEYSELLNEIAIDTFTDDNEQVYEMYYRYPFNAQLFTNSNSLKNLFWDLGISLRNEPIKRIQPALMSDNKSILRNDGSYNIFSAFFQSGKSIRNTDSIGIAVTGSEIKAFRFDRSDWTNTFTDSRFFYKFNIYNPENVFSLFANCGISTNTDHDSTDVLPVWHAGLDFQSKFNNIRLYARQNNIPFSLPFDTSYKAIQPLLDNYFQGGFEYFIHAEKMQLLFGYQYLSSISSKAIENAWPSGISPYAQPHSSFIIAPSIGRWNGFALSGSTCLSEKKPYIKTAARLSYIIHPLSTSEYIDINLGYEYWGERDLLTFAGRSDWNGPINNVDLDISIHMLSFRLYYKVDNILNRKFAYVPGYYSSGLTFRWGFNWFIQR